MYYRVLTADEPAHADENFVRKDEATGLTLVSREALPASDDALINKVILASDGALYRYDTCGKPQLIGKTKRSVNALFRAQCRRTSAINRQCARRARKLAEAANTASVSYGATLFGFRSYLYIDKQNLTSYPYRLKAARKTNMPLAVVFPSAGATGSDNVKTLFDTLLMLPALTRKGANVLVPQPYRSINEGRSFDDVKTEMSRYIDSVIALIDDVAEKTHADRSRIYLIGASLGGCCVWRALRTAPEKFACAIPLMGTAYEFMESGDCDCASLKNIPIWMAHAANDGIVSVAHDDYTAKKLAEINADFRYTRTEKYGHFLATRFLLKEKWCDWMFLQRKDA